VQDFISDNGEGTAWREMANAAISETSPGPNPPFHRLLSATSQASRRQAAAAPA